jgi:hypothetical protein
MATSKLYDAMREDHQRLERVFETLLNYVHVDDREGMQAAWDDFERGLSAHLEVEEAEMIPVLDRDNQEEAAAIRRDHAMIRRTLAELGVRLDIHLLREETVEAFVRLLRSARRPCSTARPTRPSGRSRRRRSWSASPRRAAARAAGPRPPSSLSLVARPPMRHARRPEQRGASCGSSTRASSRCRPGRRRCPAGASACRCPSATS